MGHFEPFPAPTLNGRCPFNQLTFARPRSNGRDAPKD